MQSKLTELTKDEILYSNPIVSDNKGSNVYITLESARLSMDKYAEQWKVKYDELKKEADDLKRWKREATLLLDPIIEYGQGITPLSKSTTEFVLQRAKRYEEMKERCDKMEAALKQFISYHETGLLPCRFTYEKGMKALAHKHEVINEKEGEDE